MRALGYVAETSGAYSTLIHLEDGVEKTIADLACDESVSDNTINNMLRDGDSWR